MLSLASLPPMFVTGVPGEEEPAVAAAAAVASFTKPVGASLRDFSLPDEDPRRSSCGRRRRAVEPLLYAGRRSSDGAPEVVVEQALLELVLAWSSPPSGDGAAVPSRLPRVQSCFPPAGCCGFCCVSKGRAAVDPDATAAPPSPSVAGSSNRRRLADDGESCRPCLVLELVLMMLVLVLLVLERSARLERLGLHHARPLLASFVGSPTAALAEEDLSW